jgi:OmcA/MtrC family decaheme c-type cytochrome
MQRRMKKYGGALVMAGVLALTGCSGSKGANGANGTNGTNGINGVAGKLSLTMDSVATTTSNGVTTSTLTFTIYPAAAVCPGGVCKDPLNPQSKDPSSPLGQMSFSAQELNANGFDTAKNFSFGGFRFKGFTADGNGAQYTATKASAPFAPEASASAFVYGYITSTSAVPAPTTGHYYLPGSVASASKVFGTVAYTSTANVAGCEKCHGKPYSKHGYRQATVAGLPDFASCKVCHTDQRVGSDGAWYLLADDPATYAAEGGKLTPDQVTKYAYTANIMNDVHNSHAFEFNYPQSMSNCVTCHEGKLDKVLTDANFQPKVCKSCHPVTGVNGTQPGRAPSIAQLWANANVTSFHSFDLYTQTDPGLCNSCHKAGGSGKTFAALHTGYNKAIYDGTGAKYSASIKAQVDGASFDASTNLVTVNFSVTGAAANAFVQPQVVASLYGYGTKDFLISGHSSQFADKTPNLEWAEGAVIRGTTTPANTSRLQVTPATATQGNASWVATIDLTTWASMISSGQVKRIEVAILPNLGLDQTQAVSATNPAIAIAGVTQTVAVNQTATDARIAAGSSYGKAIVDPAKCNQCHDALGTTFHTPAYGSAGVVACRLCHFVGAAASHLEMQSRSIDSYLHAIHSMQEFDIKSIDMTDPVQALEYNDHVEGNYPNFAGPLNCESCHASGTYDVPDQAKSLPGLVSASSKFLAGTRNIGTVAAEIAGPGARACGSCHRAQLINQDNATSLAAFYAHFNMYGSDVADTTLFLDTAAFVESQIGGPAFTGTVPAGAAVEQCVICHASSGSDHQALFNTWKNGL